MDCKTSALMKLGYNKECQLLQERLESNHRVQLLRQAVEWQKIPGVTVNYSFFENKKKNNYTQEEVIKAFADLGVDMKKVKDKKWHRFDSNRWNKRFLEAIKQLQNK